MPTVPRLTGPGVSTAPLPGARVSPSVAPSLGPDLGGPLGAAAQIIQDAQARADQVRVNDADNQMTTARDRILYGDPGQPETGLLGKKGQHALGAAQDAIAQWDAAKKQIGGTLNDRQRINFNNRLDGYEHQFHLEVQSHVLKETQRYDSETTDGYIQNRLQDATRGFSNDATVDKNLDLALAARKDYARRIGEPAEATQADLAKIASGFRLTTLRQLLTAPEAQGGGDLRAAAYLAAHRTELIASDLEQADRLTEAGSVRGESQRLADVIVKSATSLMDARAKAAAIQDPRVREATEQRVRQYYGDQAADDREQRSQSFSRASQVIIQGGDMDDIALEDRNRLLPGEYDSLVTLRNRLRNPVVETPPSYYQHWVNMAGISDASRQQFLSHNFGADRAAGKLSESDFHYFAHLQLQLQNRDERAETAAATRQYRSEESAVIKASKAARAYADKVAGFPDEKLATEAYGARPRVIIPRQLLDSALATPEYLDHLRISGVDVDALLAAPRGGSAPVELPPPKAPGAPIKR